MSQSQKFQGVKTEVSNVSGHLIGTYRGTDVATKKPDGKVILQSNGWRSNTTKTRMNQFANQFCGGRFSVYQKNFAWYVLVDGVKVEYQDGIII